MWAHVFIYACICKLCIQKIYTATNIESIGLKGAYNNAYPTPQNGSTVVQHKCNDFSEFGGLLRVLEQERQRELWPRRLGHVRSQTARERSGQGKHVVL